MECAGDLLSDRDGWTVVVVARYCLTDEQPVGFVQLCLLVEKGGDLLLEPHGDAAANELGPVSCEEFRADLDGQGIASDFDEDAVIQPVELRTLFEVLRGPMGVDLPVGGDQKCVTVGDEVTALTLLTRLGKEAELDRQVVRRAVVVEGKGVLSLCPGVAGIVLEPACKSV